MFHHPQHSPGHPIQLLLCLLYKKKKKAGIPKGLWNIKAIAWKQGARELSAFLCWSFCGYLRSFCSKLYFIFSLFWDTFPFQATRYFPSYPENVWVPTCFQEDCMCVCMYVCMYVFIYGWLRWVFVAARGLSLVAANRGYSSLQCTGFSLRWLLLLQSTGSRRAGFSSCGSRA